MVTATDSIRLASVTPFFLMVMEASTVVLEMPSKPKAKLLAVLPVPRRKLRDSVESSARLLLLAAPHPALHTPRAL